MKHTPTPWVADGIFILSPVEAGRVIAETRIVRGDTDTAAADAALIAKCVSAHDELVIALEQIEACCTQSADPGRIASILATAQAALRGVK